MKNTEADAAQTPENTTAADTMQQKVLQKSTRAAQLEAVPETRQETVAEAVQHAGPESMREVVQHDAGKAIQEAEEATVQEPVQQSGQEEPSGYAGSEGHTDKTAGFSSLGQGFKTRLERSLWNSRSANPLVRCGLIGFISLVLLIPLGFVQDLVRERDELQRRATSNIMSSWGSTQNISGPALVVPYEVWENRKEMQTVGIDGLKRQQEVTRKEYYTKYKFFLPSEVHFEARLDPEIRYRGIYKQALYNAPVSIQGHFTLPETSEFAPNVHAVHWEKAWLAMGVADLKTISEEKPVLWNGVATAAYKPGTNMQNMLGPGFHAAIPMTEAAAGTKQTFSIQFNVRGSEGMYFTPVGENSTIVIAGNWPSPSFQGNLLPVERTITETDFSARWTISNLTRTYPQMGELGGGEFFAEGNRNYSLITNFAAGVDLHEPVSLYRMITRAVHYGILFIAVSFVALFAFEMMSGQRMHLVQYGMVGVSMSLFYLVLLSLAEHVSFGAAFAAASAVTVSMNSLYIAAALQSKARGSIMGLLLTGLYGLLFCLLQMEDFALLVGTGLVVAMMAALMFVTRKLPQAQR